MKRIEGFLKSLESNGIMAAGQMSLVMTPEMELVGGDNSGTCQNSDFNSCSGQKNGSCTNYSVCLKSDNVNCINKPKDDIKPITGSMDESTKDKSHGG